MQIRLSVSDQIPELKNVPHLMSRVHTGACAVAECSSLKDRMQRYIPHLLFRGQRMVEMAGMTISY